MNARELALARSRTLGVLAELFLDGWTERVVALSGIEVAPEGDVRAARYQRVFGAVPPYESAFRSTDGLLGGAVVSEVREAYRGMGFQHRRTDVEPDHVGLQCAALGFLYGAESDALRDGVDPERISALAAGFLATRLGRWLDLYAAAVEAQGVAELTEAVGLALELVEHANGPCTRDEVAEPLLEDPATRLKDVARYLAVPARCGMWLSIPDIQRIAERAELACGFGRRVPMLESLWFSAVDHDAVPALCDAFSTECGRWPRGPRIEGTLATLDALKASVAGPG